MLVKFDSLFLASLLLLPLLSANQSNETVEPVHSSPLNIVKCCKQNEALDVRTKTCFQKTSVGYDYLIDLFYYSMVHTDNHYGHVLSPNSYNITSIGNPPCDYSQEDLEIVINSNEPGNDQFIIAYPSNELFETHQFKYHSNYCVDVAYAYDQYWGIAAMFCNPNLHLMCQNKTCARFCCSPGQVYDEQIGYCLPAWDTGIYQKILRLYQEQSGTELYFHDNQTELIYGVPECFKSYEAGYTSHQLQYDRILYNNDGLLKVGENYFNYEQACIVQIEKLDEYSNNHTYITQANVCAPTRVVEY